MPTRSESVQYVGEPGITLTCQLAVTRLLQHGDKIERAIILTHKNAHGLLLSVEPCELIAVRSGFGSGYSGEGARRFSYVLELLDAHGADILECSASKALFARLDSCALTTADVKAVRSNSRLSRWRQYSWMPHAAQHDAGELWQIEQFPLAVPYGLIDPRLAELAMNFWDDPDDSLVKGFRKLEDLVRRRIGSSEHGVKLFRQAFLESRSPLGWAVADSGEESSRGQLFCAAYGAFRNPRVHRELPDNPVAHLAEFLTLNQLFLLERLATLKDDVAESVNS